MNKAGSVFNGERCCGCGCCSQVCPRNLIQIKEDVKGFFRPFIHEGGDCTSCGECLKVCPMHGSGFGAAYSSGFKQKFISLQHPNEKIRAVSASGGAFSLIAEEVIGYGGRVYGAVFDSEFRILHTGVDEVNMIGPLRGSKYAQSAFWKCLPDLRKSTSSGKKCMVSATPCQIDGARRLAHKWGVERDILFVDLICHGVPSNRLFREHIADLEKKHGKILRYRSHSKLEGWHTYHDRIFSERGELNSYEDGTQHWRRIFASNVCLQDECYNCRYASLNRVGDITIGDFWGIEKHYPNRDDNKGMSLLIINSSKGDGCLRSTLSDNSPLWFEVTAEEAMQNHLYKPCKRPDGADIFWHDYKKYGWSYAAKKHGHTSMKMNILRRINRAKFINKNKGYSEVFGEIWRMRN